MHPQATFECLLGAIPLAEQVKSLLQDYLWSFLQLPWYESLFSKVQSYTRLWLEAR